MTPAVVAAVRMAVVSCIFVGISSASSPIASSSHTPTASSSNASSALVRCASNIASSAPEAIKWLRHARLAGLEEERFARLCAPVTEVSEEVSSLSSYDES